ncbi:hypothetical protein [Paenibacillus polymyxa]|uniref:Uncharacterized protein n=1 Tax=Paenibacillus polymyxa TaxID=1406 RepID=A0AAE9I882_PAEPO|nr:hypothetical protein [Paenibacillus polymyxa]URJ39958.1 hypothetical protein MF627_004553 [Paenibacillus polymyxa]URJ49195.1 hypothetical protein MF626_003538 [Paenibacillus polymyxa]
MSKARNTDLPTEAIAVKYDMLSPMLDSALLEMREFSKKKQDGVLNPLKVKVLNRLLSDIKEILSSDPSTEYLDILDDESLPQNSDAVLILGQFRAAMNQFRGKYYGYYGGTHRWLTVENPKI